MNTHKKIASMLGAITMVALMFPKLVLADTPAFLTGDIMTGTNNTTGNGTWSDPVSANPGEVIEMRIVAQNQQPNSTANNVIVSASLPQTVASTITATGTVSADNAPSVSDTLTVNILGGTSQAFGDVAPGHTRVFSNSCPSGCTVADTIMSGVNVGNLGPGESAQVLFKVYITNIVTSPSPTPTPTPTPTVTPTPTPSASVTVSCPAGTVQTVSGSNIICISNVNNNTNNNTQNQTQNVTVQAAAQPAAPKVVTVAATPVKQLPSTGLPIGGLALSGLAPVGWALRKFGQGKEDVTDALPYLISKARESKKFFS